MQIIATTTNEFSFLITLMKKQIQVSFNLINKSKKKVSLKKNENSSAVFNQLYFIVIM